MSGERVTKRDEDRFSFWKEFIRRHRRDSCSTETRDDEWLKGCLEWYVEEKLFKIYKDKCLSWEKFKEDYLVQLQKVTESLRLDRHEISDACRSGYEEAKGLHETFMCWDEFKKRYLPMVKYLAEILELDRDEIVQKSRDFHSEDSLKMRGLDDDWVFVEGVIGSFIDWEGKCKWEEKPRLWKLRETDGAEEIFHEIYRIWLYQEKLYDGEMVFMRKFEGPGRRSEAGTGDIIDIFLIDPESDETLLKSCLGEDFADSAWPVVVKVKQKACINNRELAKALRDLADTLDRYARRREQLADTDAELLAELEDL